MKYCAPVTGSMIILKSRHGALQSQEASVIKVVRIVESILIEDERVGECADFQKPVPIRGVARQSRDLQAEHDRVCDIEVEVRTRGGSPNSPRSGR